MISSALMSVPASTLIGTLLLTQRSTPADPTVTDCDIADVTAKARTKEVSNKEYIVLFCIIECSFKLI
jgi:hypothetical protein